MSLLRKDCESHLTPKWQTIAILHRYREWSLASCRLQSMRRFSVFNPPPTVPVVEIAESDQEQNVPLDLSPVAGGPLAGQESQRAVARSLELTVGHLCDGVRGGGLSSCVVSLSRRSACGLFRDGGSLREWPVRRRRAPKLSRLARPPC